MPAEFKLREPDGWQVYPKPDRSGAEKIFIAGYITDPEVPGDNCYAEFWLSESLLSTFPSDEAGQRKAINEWLAARVDERHLLWRDELTRRSPAPVTIPPREVAAIIGDPRDREARLRIERTHKDNGRRPEELHEGADLSTPAPPPTEFDAFGKRREKKAEEAPAASAPPAPTQQQPAQPAAPPASSPAPVPPSSVSPAGGSADKKGGAGK